MKGFGKGHGASVGHGGARGATGKHVGKGGLTVATPAQPVGPKDRGKGRANTKG